MRRQPYLVANWKMHKGMKEVESFVATFLQNIADMPSGKCDVAIAPQAIHLSLLQNALKNRVGVVAQNCGQSPSGAFTGEVSPVALKEAGVKAVILGHSERRWIFHEADTLITARVLAALEAGLEVILCVGERLVDRKEGKTFLVLEEQLRVLELVPGARLPKITVAYEPVWAIGTGETATPAQAQEAHAFIRQWIHDHFSEITAQSMRLLYGGSAKLENAASLLAEKDVDGLLIGGASLEPLAFAEMVRLGVRSQA